MPAMPAVPQTIRVALGWWIGEDTRALSRFFMQYAGSAPTLSDLNTFATSVAGDWTAHLAGEFSTGIALNEVAIEDLTSSTGATGGWAGTDLGTRAGNELSAGAAAVLRNHVNRRYRGGHSRLYLPAGVVADCTGPGQQTWSGAFQAGLSAAWIAFITAVSGHKWSGATSLSQVNVSFFQGFTNVLYPSGRYHAVPTLRATPVIDTVSGYSVNPQVGSQRRRYLQST